MRVPRLPAAPAALALAIVAGHFWGAVGFPAMELGVSLPSLSLPEWRDFATALPVGVVPQLPLTLVNAVIVTAVVARELLPHSAGRASERNLAFSTGLANLALAPLGAMPMCHGASGLQAQHRFGARTGLAPILFGIVLLVLAFGFSESAAALFAAIPAGAVGALLLIAGADLALSRRMFDARPDCWPAIALAALGTALINPAIGLAAGWGAEIARAAARRVAGDRSAN
jgi:MFS superfamily sulfate permease-like transporter